MQIQDTKLSQKGAKIPKLIQKDLIISKVFEQSRQGVHTTRTGTKKIPDLRCNIRKEETSSNPEKRQC